MKVTAPLLTSCLISSVSLASAQATPVLPTVKLSYATYQGTTTKITVSPGSSPTGGAARTVEINKFLGVRFGAPPTRFLAARLPSPSNSTVQAGVIKATKQPPSCTDSEDCLFLNLFAPAPAPNNSNGPAEKNKKPVPVMIWWHGGALQSGSISSSPDGSILAAGQDVLVLAAQYRLGVFGFPGSVPGIPSDQLNTGFRDQQLVLDWVRDNIALFGGDPDKVTIFGESAGAVSVDAKLLSPLTFNNDRRSSDGNEKKKLFHGAIMQSGGLHTFTRVALGIGRDVTGLGTGNREDEMPFFTLARALNCLPLQQQPEQVLSCVQAKTFNQVENAVSQLNLLFPPVDDAGLSSVGDSDSARRANRTVHVPILLGSTFDEGNIFPTAGIASKTFDQWVDVIYPDHSNNSTSQGVVAANRQAVKKAYGIGTSYQITSENDAKHMLHSDFHFACTTTYDANLIATLKTNKVWRYLFNATGLPGGKLAGHGSDVNFVFGAPPASGGGNANSKANQELSKKMMDAWGRFARDPEAGPGWLPYGSPGVRESLANLGGEGPGRDGITMVDPVVVDKRCAVFDDAYDPYRPRS